MPSDETGAPPDEMLLQWILAAEKHVQLAQMREQPTSEDLEHIGAALVGARDEFFRVRKLLPSASAPGSALPGAAPGAGSVAR